MDTDKVLLEQYVCTHPKEAARSLEKLNNTEITAILNELSLKASLNMLGVMNSYIAAKSMELMDLEDAMDLFEKMDLPIAEAILRRCEPSFSDKIVDAMPPKLASVLSQKLMAKENTVASYMDPVVFGLKKHRTAAESIKLIKQVKKGVGSFVCVVDEYNKYMGIVMLNELLFADGQVEIASLIDTDSPSFTTDASTETLADNPVWNEFKSVPVIDIDGKLAGILHFKAVQKNAMDPNNELNRQIIETSNSLGELYGIGLSGFLHVISK